MANKRPLSPPLLQQHPKSQRSLRKPIFSTTPILSLLNQSLQMNYHRLFPNLPHQSLTMIHQIQLIHPIKLRNLEFNALLYSYVLTNLRSFWSLLIVPSLFSIFYNMSYTKCSCVLCTSDHVMCLKCFKPYHL